MAINEMVDDNDDFTNGHSWSKITPCLVNDALKQWYLIKITHSTKMSQKIENIWQARLSKIGYTIRICHSIILSKISLRQKCCFTNPEKNNFWLEGGF